jgi:enterochelin esterase-like enzyme
VQCKLLDSLNTFADRVKVQPMIIVAPSAGGAPGVGAYGKTADPFVTDLAIDIRGYVESHYKADTSRWARAISGLSAGAVQTWNLTLFYPELWGWSLPMSGGLNLSVGFSHARVKADVASKAIDVAAINRLKLIKAYANPSDVAYNDTQNFCRLADTVGIKVQTDFTTRTSGGHKPVYWNEVFRKYAPLLFKE